MTLNNEKVRALADAVHDGLVSACDVPAHDRFQLISAFDSSNMIIDPHYPDVTRTSDASIVEILFIGKYSREQKKNLYRKIVYDAAAAGFVGDDILIALIENTVHDWSAGHGRCFADV